MCNVIFRFTLDLWKDSRNVVTPLKKCSQNIFARFKERCMLRFKSYRNLTKIQHKR